jgi:translation initiation factor 2 beta subunit (eIF-2beta)/eIF-5
MDTITSPTQTDLPTLNAQITQNIANNDVLKIDKYIEEQIEKKLNTLLETLPDKDLKPYKPVYNFTVLELYKNTLQTIIDIINEITELYNEDKEVTMKKIYEIALVEDRKIFVGILLVALAFIVYFIDGLYI